MTEIANEKQTSEAGKDGGSQTPAFWKRAVEISNFRNLGIGHEANLLLNADADIEGIGDLVILLGANNSGKSNVLDAICSLNDKGPIPADEKPDFVLDRNLSPEISLSVRKGSEFYRVWKSSSSDLRAEGSQPIADNGFRERFSYELKPQIIRYEEKQIRNSDLSVRSDEIASNPLFVSLFRVLGIRIPEISRSYESFKKTNNKAYLTRLSDRLARGLRRVSTRFNEMYPLSGDIYCGYWFDLDFESAGIFLTISQGGKPLDLEKQSTGFRNFFDLFFNCLNTTPLNPGDILLFEEPGIHIHPMGQRELRRFLKEFAIKNQVTIVITNHSPSMVDLDNLDELRLIRQKKEGADIVNDFALGFYQRTDTLAPVQRALTVENYQLIDPSKRLIFVEGVTDYDYLTAFMQSLYVNDFIFIPVNGLGKKGEIRERIPKILQMRRDAVLLADSGETGLEIKKDSEGTGLTVINLGELNPKWKEIEDLFSKKDAEFFHVAERKSRNAAALKHRLLAGTYEFSEKTVSNFTRFFEQLQDNI